MSLSKRLFLIVLALFVVSMLLLEVVTYRFTTLNFEEVLSHFQVNMKDMQKSTVESFAGLSRQSAEDMIHEIKIAVGEALQPGEGAKFMYLAEQQKKLKELKEFSFVGPDMRIELSSESAAVGKKIAEDVWDEGKRTKTVVFRDEQDTFVLYEPLFVDADMVRFHPEWNVGMYYGMLLVRFSKDRVAQLVESCDRQIGATMEDARGAYNSAVTRIMWIGIGIMAVCLLAIAAVLGYVVYTALPNQSAPSSAD
jgi:hypothetical protein